MIPPIPTRSAAARAKAWRQSLLASVCDVLEPWDHGIVARTKRYPAVWDYNVVVAERDPGLAVDELIDTAERLLDGCAHRRIDFFDAPAAEPLRAGFHARGWRTLRLVWMLHAAPAPAHEAAAAAVDEVPYEAVQPLREAWYREDFPDTDGSEFHAGASALGVARRARVLAVHDGGVPVAYAQLDHHAGAAEVGEVYVRPSHRGRGLGTAVTCAAIEAARGVDDLWITADDEDRPKNLYARLGFRPVWRTLQAMSV